MSLITEFLSQVHAFLRSQDGEKLKTWLQVDPSSHQQYHALGAELRQAYSTNQRLDQALEQHLPQDDDVDEDQGTAWPGFISFMRDYLTYWRDAKFSDLSGTHELLSTLLSSCGQAFSNPTYGTMLLKTCVSLSEALARLTMTLHKKPTLVRKVAGGDDERKGIVEASAESIQKIFTTCTMDRSGGGRDSQPEGKKVGMYKLANLVLKLLFACKRTHLAKMIFVNISSNSPSLSHFPASERVSFLYYLGRFYLSNHHYLRAARCLEDAYLQTPPAFVSHRTNILTFLIPANVLLGRFPSDVLMSRPESQSLRSVYLPLCHAITKGNFVTFQHHLATHETWLLQKGLFLTFTHRLRPLLWRSLSRRTFLFTYVSPTDAATSRKAATLDLHQLHIAAVFVQHLLEGWVTTSNPSLPGRGSQANPLFMKAVSNLTASDSTLSPPAGGPKKLRPNEGLIWGNTAVTYDDVELMVAVLVEQGLIHGFIAHGQARFAIIGAKAKGSPVLAGWPTVWQKIKERRYEQDFDIDDIPALVK